MSYAEAFGQNARIFLLRNNLFGSFADIRSNWSSHKISSQFLQPNFLLLPEPDIPDHRRIFLLRKLHNQFKDFLRNINLDLIILGADTTGIGHWTAVVAKELGIKTIVCQEGCRFFHTMHTPAILKIKQFAYNFVSFLIYKPAMFCRVKREYQTADYAFVWGHYEKECVTKEGKNKENIYVIGDPRIKYRAANKTKDGKLKILFLDVSVMHLPKGTADVKAFLSFNKELVAQAEQVDCAFFYKPHPFVTQNELEYLKDLLKNKHNVTLVTEKTAEEYFEYIDICISYPSTSIYGILAAGIPLVLINFKARGFSSLLWDPIKLYNAGLYINYAHELGKILKTINQ
jgi:hypothetical protein